MYPYYSPAPLKTTEFYILLALADSPMYAYAIKSAVANMSLGSVQLKDGKLYPMINLLMEEGLLEPAGTAPVGVSGKPRRYYALSEFGRIRLQEEAKRLDHAVQILLNQGFLDYTVPTDIQRLLLEIETYPEG